MYSQQQYTHKANYNTQQVNKTYTNFFKVAGAINDIKSAEEIVNEMVTGAIAVLKSQTNLVSRL